MLRSPDRGSGQNQNNTHYATGNENPDQHIHALNPMMAASQIHSEEPQT